MALRRSRRASLVEPGPRPRRCMESSRRHLTLARSAGERMTTGAASIRWRDAFALGALSLAACRGNRGLFRPERAVDQRDAGSVHVAVLAVAPWSHYESALQPEFQLDAEQAL